MDLSGPLNLSDPRHRKIVKLLARITIAAVMFVICFNFANSAFFNENPLFGVPFLAEFSISVMGALVGFFIIPDYFFRARRWLEQVIRSTIQQAAGDFWNQYTAKQEQGRQEREKQRKKEARQKKSSEKQLKEKEKLRNGVVLDTSVLVDGRVLNIAKSGFIPQPLIVPKNVITELQLLADNEDTVIRKKGRRGLDLVNELKEYSKVIIYHGKFSSEKVDDALVDFAKECDLKIMTLDFNLAKVAEVSNVVVLNPNQLAEAIKPEFIPGDKFNIKIVQQGKEKNQGVGYLSDGTMIVVKNAQDYIGEEVAVTVEKLIQSPAGKMVFCAVSS